MKQTTIHTNCVRKQKSQFYAYLYETNDKSSPEEANKIRYNKQNTKHYVINYFKNTVHNSNNAAYFRISVANKRHKNKS